MRCLPKRVLVAKMRAKLYGLELGEAITVYFQRRRRGLTRAEFGELMGVDRSMVAHWERGDLAMTEAQVQKFKSLCKAVPSKETKRQRSSP